MCAAPGPRLERHRGAERDTRPAWMTKGCGIGEQMFGEMKGDDLVKPGMTRSQLDAIESQKGKPLDGPDPFGEVFKESSSGRRALKNASEEKLKKRKRTSDPGSSESPSPKRDGSSQRCNAIEESCQESVKAQSNEPIFAHKEAMSFDGTGEDIVNVPYETALNPDGSFSVDFWARPAPAGSGLRSPVCSRELPPPRGYSFFVTPQGHWAFWLGVPEAQAWLKVEGTKAREGEWQRVTGTYDSEIRSASIFVDGELCGTLNASTLEPPFLKTVFESNRSKVLRFGASGTEGSGNVKAPFVGDVRDFCIYKCSLLAPLPSSPNLS